MGQLAYGLCFLAECTIGDHFLEHLAGDDLHLGRDLVVFVRLGQKLAHRWDHRLLQHVLRTLTLDVEGLDRVNFIVKKGQAQANGIVAVTGIRQANVDDVAADSELAGTFDQAHPFIPQRQQLTGQ